MSDFTAWCLVVAFLLQTIAFGAFIVGDSVTNRRLRRVAEELVMVRAAIRGGSGDVSANDEAGGSK